MSQINYRDIIYNGLWKQNPGIVQFLGLCPLLMMSNSFINAFSLGLATTLVMSITGAMVAGVRHWIPNELRNPIFVLIIAAIVTVLELAMNAYLHSLYSVLGIFIPLITTNCIVLARAEAFASKHSIKEAGLDGFIMGIGLTLVLALLGSLREIIGSGSLFVGANQLFGDTIGNAMRLHIPNYQGFILAILPPGAFIGLGCLLALRAWWEQKSTKQQAQKI